VLGLNVVGAKVEMTTTIKKLKALANLKKVFEDVNTLQRATEVNTGLFFTRNQLVAGIGLPAE